MSTEYKRRYLHATPIVLAMLFQQPLAAVTAKLYNKAFPAYRTEKNSQS